MNTQIKDELEVYSKESVLSEAKRIKGLRAVFGEVSSPSVRVLCLFILCFLQFVKACSLFHLGLP